MVYPFHRFESVEPAVDLMMSLFGRQRSQSGQQGFKTQGDQAAPRGGRIGRLQDLDISVVAEGPQCLQENTQFVKNRRVVHGMCILLMNFSNGGSGAERDPLRGSPPQGNGVPAAPLNPAYFGELVEEVKVLARLAFGKSAHRNVGVDGEAKCASNGVKGVWRSSVLQAQHIVMEG